LGEEYDLVFIKLFYYIWRNFTIWRKFRYKFIVIKKDYFNVLEPYYNYDIREYWRSSLTIQSK